MGWLVGQSAQEVGVEVIAVLALQVWTLLPPALSWPAWSFLAIDDDCGLGVTPTALINRSRAVAGNEQW
jgi:hypothetical protein